MRSGIDALQDYCIIVHPCCPNFTAEISTYCWAQDKNGKWLNEPVDEANHLMDAMRYGMEEMIEGPNFSFD